MTPEVIGPWVGKVMGPYWSDQRKAYSAAFKRHRDTETPYPMKRLRTRKPLPGELPISDSEEG